MRVQDWFPEFVVTLTEMFPRGDWPPLDAEFWTTLDHIFRVKGVTQEVAIAAARLLFEDPPQFVVDYPKALLEKIRACWKSGQVTPQSLDDPTAAQQASRDCEDCSGSGFATRYPRPPLEARAQDRAQSRVPYVLLYCLCPYGRFLEKNHRIHSPEIRKRIQDLRDFPALQDGRFRNPPTREELEPLPAF
jgi:hypothetical protein